MTSARACSQKSSFARVSIAVFPWIDNCHWRLVVYAVGKQPSLPMINRGKNGQKHDDDDDVDGGGSGLNDPVLQMK